MTKEKRDWVHIISPNATRIGGKNIRMYDRQTRLVNEKAGQVLCRLLVCFFLMSFTSFYVMTDVVTTGNAQEIKKEIKEGIRETKEELKKMPEELKKAGKEIKKKSEEVKINVEADIEEGKRNVRSLTK